MILKQQKQTSNFQIEIVVQKHILRFDVAMSNALTMAIPDGCSQEMISML